MTNKNDKSATIKASGKSITVYKLKNGNWCDSVNCTDEYKPEEIRLK